MQVFFEMNNYLQKMQVFFEIKKCLHSVLLKYIKINGRVWNPPLRRLTTDH